LEQRVARTFCRVCEAHCGLVVNLDAAGQASRLLPDRTHPVSRGFACLKGTNFLRVSRDECRLTRPLRRLDSGAFAPTDWDAALATFGSRIRAILQEHGPHAVAFYLGTPAIHNALGAMAYFAFARAVGTRNLFSAGSQDNDSKIVAARLVHGNEWIQPIMDLEHAQFALMLGTNPAVSRGTYAMWEGGTRAFDRFVARGGKAVWVDPQRTASAERWGEHVPIRPGTDIFLLLALMHELAQRRAPHAKVEGLEQWLTLAADYPPRRAATLTGIPSERIEALARSFGDAQHATCFVSVGVSQSGFGTLCAVAVQALAALTGNLDREGGLLFQPWASALAPLLRFSQQRSRIGGYMANAGGLPAGILADEILTPGAERIRALVVFAGNPLTSAPDETRLREAFRHLDLLVSIDLFQNETGRESHLVLPATSWLERFDVGAWEGQFTTAAMLPVTSPAETPPGEARPEWRIFADLSVAAGRPFLGSLTRALARLNWDRALARGTIMLCWLLRGGRSGSFGLPWRRPRGGHYLRGRRRIRLWCSEMDDERARLARWSEACNPATAPPGTLLLIGRRRRLGHNSWLHGAGPRGDAEAYAWLCADDMQTLGLDDADAIELSTDAGQLTLAVRLHTGVMRGVVVVPHGLPGLNVNRLIPGGPEFIEPLSGMHRMSGQRVNVRRAAPMTAR
jgi:formate dehydrogenase